jgi:hypothetical protein
MFDAVLVDTLFLTSICRHKEKQTAADVNVLPDIHAAHCYVYVV